MSPKAAAIFPQHFHARERQEESISAKALSGAAILAFEQGDYVAARPLCGDALTMQERSGDRAGMAVSLGVLASLACIKGDYESARALYEHSLAIRRDLGDHRGVAASLTQSRARGC